MNRYNQVAGNWRVLFGTRLQKISLDAGFTCPNRDGTLSRRGCIFCNPHGSGTGLGAQSLSEQWQYWIDYYQARGALSLYIAYLQAFSNTYGPYEKFDAVLSQLEALPHNAGMSIGTRPDCLDEQKLARMALTKERISRRLQQEGYSAPAEMWLELGVQSSNNDTLTRIARGHNFAQVQNAVQLANAHDIPVCVHVMAGLPQETWRDFEKTVADVCALPISGIKFHCLYVVRHTVMETLWQRGDYTPPEMEDYAACVAKLLPRIPSRIIIHRLTSDAVDEDWLAPAWSVQKAAVIRRINALLCEQNTWQGKNADVPNAVPLWYSLKENLPKTEWRAWKKSWEEHKKERT